MSTGAQQVAEATPDDVAALLRARTKDAAGRELGRWTEDTRPNEEQVQEQIEIARVLVRGDVSEIPEGCAEIAEATVALTAALLVEAGYFPEQVAQGNSPYDRLLALQQQAKAGLEGCILRHYPGGMAGGGVYELDLTGARCAWPVDWWQRNLETLP